MRRVAGLVTTTRLTAASAARSLCRNAAISAGVSPNSKARG
jgi:hypothetical protein